jgi:hypothetical protein
LTFSKNLALRTFSDEHFVVEQFTGTKFISEKLWLDNEDFFIVTMASLLTESPLLGNIMQQIMMRCQN